MQINRLATSEVGSESSLRESALVVARAQGAEVFADRIAVIVPWTVSKPSQEASRLFRCLSWRGFRY